MFVVLTGKLPVEQFVIAEQLGIRLDTKLEYLDEISCDLAEYGL